MNHVKSALLSGHRPHRLAAAAPQQLAATASFHSTPPLQRKRKTQWQHRFNFYAKRRRNRDTKRTMIRNMSEYAEQLFNSWRDEDEKKDASSGPSWFRGHRWVRDSRNNGFRPHEFFYDTVKSRGDLSFAQAMMMMNQRLFFAMLFVGTSTHIIGLLNLMIFQGGIQDVLIQKVPDTGVMKQTMRAKYPPRQRYLWRIPDVCT
ncbi:unnamed protein product [Triticum turgidum subsp. durum]|uniref:Uncharacterized protein n=1 Tax=Triticum turgidum subsp. durum TaxID=4567 RepID=A0A9R0UZQ5_TRITD|nr:unnamed protein product [Triticum turgidum subsp. durum]